MPTPSRVARFRRLGQLVVGHARAILVLTACATLAMLFGVARLRVDQSIDGTVPPRHPYTLVDRSIREEFGGTLTVMALVTPDEGTVWRTDVLEMVWALTQALRVQPGVLPHSIVSLASPTARQIRADGDRLAAEYLMRSVPTDAAGIAAVRSVVEANPLYRNVLVTPNGRGALVSADFDRVRDPTAIAAAMRALVEREQRPGVRILLTGQPIILNALQEYVGRIGYWYAAAFTVVLGVLWWSLGGLQAMLAPIATATLSCLWSLGLVGLCGITVDAYSTIAPILVMAVAAGHSVQMLKRYAEECEHAPDPRAAVVESVAQTGPVMVAAGLTAALGFAALMVFELPSLRNFGLVAAVGVLNAVVLELTFMPALRSVLRTAPPRALRNDRGDRVAAVLAGWLSGRGATVILLATTAVLVIAGIGIRRVTTEYRLAGLLPENTPERADQERIREQLPGIYTIVLAASGDHDVASDPRLVAYLHALQQDLAADPSVVRTISYADVLAYANGVLGDSPPGTPLERLVPDNGPLVAQLLYLTYSDVYRPLLTPDFQKAALWVFLPSEDVAVFRGVIERAKAFVARTPPPPGVTMGVAGGLGALIVALTDTIVDGKVLNVLVVLGAVFVVASALLRSLVDGLLVIVPLVVTLVMQFGVMGYAGISLSPSTATIAGLTMGIGADYAVYLLYRYQEALGAGGSVRDALESVLRTSGRAVVVVAMAIGGGFGVLALSSFQPFRLTGLFVAMGMLTSSAGALLPMLALLAWIRPRPAVSPEITVGTRRGVVLGPTDDALRAACLTLREVDYAERGWTDAAGEDRYDAVSWFIAVLDGTEVVAAVRTTAWRPDIGFMLDRDFAALVDAPDEVMRDRTSIEVSRLVTRRERGDERLADLLLLFRVWLRHARQLGVERAYCVMTERFLGNFGDLEATTGRTMRKLGGARAIGPGGPSQAWCLDLVAVVRDLPAAAPEIATMLDL